MCKSWGGYSLTALFRVFSRLAERWWEYAERKETSHQTYHGGGKHDYSAGRVILFGIWRLLLQNSRQDGSCAYRRIWTDRKYESYNRNTSKWDSPIYIDNLTRQGSKHELSLLWRDRLVWQRGYSINGFLCRSGLRIHNVITTERGWSCA